MFLKWTKISSTADLKEGVTDMFVVVQRSIDFWISFSKVFVVGKNEIMF